MSSNNFARAVLLRPVLRAVRGYDRTDLAIPGNPMGWCSGTRRRAQVPTADRLPAQTLRRKPTRSLRGDLVHSTMDQPGVTSHSNAPFVSIVGPYTETSSKARVLISPRAASTRARRRPPVRLPESRTATTRPGPQSRRAGGDHRLPPPAGFGRRKTRREHRPRQRHRPRSARAAGFWPDPSSPATPPSTNASRARSTPESRTSSPQGGLCSHPSGCGTPESTDTVGEYTLVSSRSSSSAT